MLKKLCKSQVFHSQKNKIAIMASFINAGGELISRFQGCYINVKNQININGYKSCYFRALEAEVITG